MAVFSLQKETNLKYIDFLKGIAILGVVLVHYNQSFNAPNMILRALSGLGANGVQIFFVVSTFLLWKSFSKMISPSTKDSVHFVKSKILRVIPLYFLALLFYITMQLSLNVLGVPVKWQSVFCHFSLINGFFPYYINDIMGVEWYLADLFILFAITPLLFRYVNNLRRAVLSFLVAIAVAYLIQLLYACTIHNFGLCNNYDIKFFFSTAGFFVQFPCMLMGVILYYLVHNYSDVKRVSCYIIATVFVGTIAFVSSRLFGIKIFSASTWMCLAVGGAFCLLSMCDRFFDNKYIFAVTLPFCYLGKHSFGIYLFHLLIIKTVSHFLSIEFSSILLWFLFYLTFVIVSLLIGNIGESFDKRIQRRMKRV